MGTPAPLWSTASPPQFWARVCCGKTAVWIKMRLGSDVNLDPGDILLDEDPDPPKGHSPHPKFLAHVCCGQMAGWIKMLLGMEVDLSPGHIALDGDPAQPSEGAQQPPPLFGRCLL